MPRLVTLPLAQITVNRNQIRALLCALILLAILPRRDQRRAIVPRLEARIATGSIFTHRFSYPAVKSVVRFSRDPYSGVARHLITGVGRKDGLTDCEMIPKSHWRAEVIETTSRIRNHGDVDTCHPRVELIMRLGSEPVDFGILSKSFDRCICTG